MIVLHQALECSQELMRKKVRWTLNNWWCLKRQRKGAANDVHDSTAHICCANYIFSFIVVVTVFRNFQYLHFSFQLQASRRRYLLVCEHSFIQEEPCLADGAI